MSEEGTTPEPTTPEPAATEPTPEPEKTPEPTTTRVGNYELTPEQMVKAAEYGIQYAEALQQQQEAQKQEAQTPAQSESDEDDPLAALQAKIDRQEKELAELKNSSLRDKLVKDVNSEMKKSDFFKGTTGEAREQFRHQIYVAMNNGLDAKQATALVEKNMKGIIQAQLAEQGESKLRDMKNAPDSAGGSVGSPEVKQEPGQAGRDFMSGKTRLAVAAKLAKSMPS